MNDQDFPAFRTGDILATVFTGTLTERHGDTVERIPTPGRLRDWLAVNGLAVQHCTQAELAAARELREAIHLAGTAAALGEPLPVASVNVINDAARRGDARLQLSSHGERRWQLGGSGPARVEDALAVIAADAITVLQDSNRPRLALCASPTCREMFVDTSQSHTRRWCDMSICGNHAKKQRHRAATRPSNPS